MNRQISERLKVLIATCKTLGGCGGGGGEGRGGRMAMGLGLSGSEEAPRG